MDTIEFLIENPNVFLILIALLSLMVGSFLNVLIYRLPLMIQNTWNQECREYLGLKRQAKTNDKLNLWLPLSHCIECKKRLKPWHTIPVISYLILGGKCAYCYAKISVRYPLVELLCCITSVYVAWRFGISWQTLAALFFTWILISLTFIDLDHQLLPDQLTFLLLWLGLIASMYSLFSNCHDAIIGAIAGYLVFALTQGLFKLATGKIGMGQGDYKFLAALGAYLGWQQLPVIVLLASFIGTIFGLTHMIIKRQHKSIPLPFGPYLAIAGWISLIWGKDISHLYFYHFVI
ncbi:MAG: outO [Gammaproteobacteria bacterium]|jgi:leader peptidase (prepilin peptidase)/N-methyltransferase|nr:outO [Gammaproteobacteria bacterium]